MTYDNEAVVRHAYHTAEGNVLDIAGFVASFTQDGVFNNVVAQESYRGERLGDVVLDMAKLLPDVHRELHRVSVLGDVVAVELSIQGTFLGPLETPAGAIQPTGARIDVPTADFWYLRDGKIQTFNCYRGVQRHVRPDGRAARLRVGGRGACRRALSGLRRHCLWEQGKARICGPFLYRADTFDRRSPILRSPPMVTSGMAIQDALATRARRGISRAADPPSTRRRSSSSSSRVLSSWRRPAIEMASRGYG